MSEQDHMERLLRQAMGQREQPRLSSHFDRRLARHLRRRALSPSGRRIMWLYVVIAMAISVSVMRRASLDWPAIGGALVVAAVIAVLLARGVGLVPAKGPRRVASLPRIR